MALNTVNGRPIEFYAGTAQQYNAVLSDSSKFNPRAFYLVFSDSEANKCQLYVGNNLVSAIDVDSALSDVSENPVSNKVVKAAIDNATEVINNSDGSLTENDLKVGKFVFTASDITETYTLTFHPTVGKEINLIPAQEYDASSNAAMSGVAIAQAIEKAIQDSDIFDVVETTVDTNSATTVNKFYLEKSSGRLFFNSAAGGLVELTDRAKTLHSSTTEEYGISTAEEYGHAKSGIIPETNGTVLQNAYVPRNNATDTELVGDETTYKATFARLLHKHPLPSLEALADDSSTSEAETFYRKTLTDDTYDFIKATTDAPYTFYTDGTNKVIPASKRLTELETNVTNIKNDYVSKSVTNVQTISSSIVIKGNLNLDEESYLGASKIVPYDYDGVTLPSSAVEFPGSIKVNGIENTSTLSTKNTTIDGYLKQSNGEVELGKFGDVVGLAVRGTSSTNAQITISYPMVTNGITVQGEISAGSSKISTSGLIEAGSLNAGLLHADSAKVYIGESTSPYFQIDTSSSQLLLQNLSDLTIGIAQTTFSEKVDINKLTVSGTFEYTGSSFQFNGKSFSLTATDSSSALINIIPQRLTIGSNQVLYKDDIDDDNGLIRTYVNNKLSGYQVAGTYLQPGDIAHTYNPSGTDAVSGKAIAAALSTFSTTPFVYTDDGTAPSNQNILWIDGSISNGVLKYYKNDAEGWTALSAVWS